MLLHNLGEASTDHSDTQNWATSFGKGPGLPRIAKGGGVVWLGDDGGSGGGGQMSGGGEGGEGFGLGGGDECGAGW